MGAAIAGTVRDALGAATDSLRAAGAETARLDAELLLAEALGADRAELVADPGRDVDAVAARSFGAMVRRRVAREPVAYILGRRGFRHLDLAVDGRALIPRPETELLVELALELEPRRVVDVGTGCGAVALAIASELPGVDVIATDTSPAALGLARENARRLGLAHRVTFAEGSLPDPLEADLLVANLPYVAESDWDALAPEITRWEPRRALVAGPTGLEAIDELLGALAVSGQENALGAIALEVGIGQAGAIAELARRAGFDHLDTRADLAGIDRLVLARR
jgi:release factor glutamine methyltransferase